MKRIIAGALCGLLVLSAVSTASAAIRITKIYFDSPGSDTGSNSSLNAEWIRLKNTGSKGKSLTGWTIRDAASHVYKFGTYTLSAGSTVTVHTGSGSNSASHRYWANGSYIWNNDGDNARLKNGGGTSIDTCSYSGSGSYKIC